MRLLYSRSILYLRGIATDACPSLFRLEGRCNGSFPNTTIVSQLKEDEFHEKSLPTRLFLKKFATLALVHLLRKAISIFNRGPTQGIDGAEWTVALPQFGFFAIYFPGVGDTLGLL